MRERGRSRSDPGGVSCFRTAALQGKDALWTLLNKDHDEQQHGDLGQHGAGPAFQQLAEHAQSQSRIDGARQLPYTAQHRQMLDDVLQRLREGEKMVAVVAPAILGQYNAPTEKVYGAIKAIGFEDVIEVAQGAMETIRNEGAELEEKIEEGQAFMTTSCCPSWVELANKHIPEMKPFISSTGSPMYYAARIAKEKHPDAQVVFIGPCVAKRKEARRDECVDFVMTFEEINSIFDGLGIEVATTDPFPIPFVSTRAAHGFAQAGGVMGAVQLFLADNNRPQVEGIQVSNLNKKNVSLLRAYAKSGKAPAKFIEVMACEGGCITGPSTHNLHDAGKRQFAKELAKR